MNKIYIETLNVCDIIGEQLKKKRCFEPEAPWRVGENTRSQIQNKRGSVILQEDLVLAPTIYFHIISVLFSTRIS